MYKKSFHNFQKEYISKNKNSLRMRDFLPKNTKDILMYSILDVGCGSGLDIQYFNKIGFRKISGIDITGSLVNIARINNPYAEIVHGTFHNLEWQNNFFDIVWSKYALQVESNITKSIYEIYRVLKKGGMALIQVTHPFRTGFIQGNYFNEKSITYKTNGYDFKENHIMISSWINTFLSQGFTILEIEEVLNRDMSDYSGIITPSAIIFILKK